MRSNIYRELNRKEIIMSTGRELVAGVVLVCLVGIIMFAFFLTK